MGEVPIVYRYMTLDQMRRTYSVTDPRHWFSVTEWDTCRRIGDVRRRELWLMGRLLAKRLILDHHGAPSGSPLPDPLKIFIDSGDMRQRGRRPCVKIDGNTQPWSLSLSHTDDALLVSLAYQPDLSVGVDLVKPTHRGHGLAQFFLTTVERCRLAGRLDEDRISTYWAIKEAVYKACNHGESFAPKLIEIFTLGNGNYTCRYRGVSLVDRGQIRAWRVDRHIAVLVTVVTVSSPKKSCP